MKIGIVIPWRETPSRLKPFEETLSWYKKHFADALFYFPDAPGDKWQPSATRNLGVRQAEADSCDIIVMADADTIPEIQSLTNTINSAVDTDYIHNPYTSYKIISYTETQEYFNGHKTDINNLDGNYFDHACGGVWVFKPSSWWLIGGMDEKFIGWGYEDPAYEHAHKVIHGVGFRKHPGLIVGLGHEAQDGGRRLKGTSNQSLYRQYLHITDPQQMLNFIKSK